MSQVWVSHIDSEALLGTTLRKRIFSKGIGHRRQQGYPGTNPLLPPRRGRRL